MKEIIIPLLQQRMDKCTSEQFWTVGALTAADAFIITKGQVVGPKMPFSWILIALITVATVWGVRIIVSRHNAYYRNRAAMVLLLGNEKDVPDFLKNPANPWTFNSLSGVVFYVLWVVAGWGLCFFAG